MNITFTEIEVDKGNVAKKYIVDADGKLSVKSAANIYSGKAEVKSIPAESFSEYLKELGGYDNKCITLGTFGEVGEVKELTTKDNVKDDFIARTKDFFDWCNSGNIGLIYLDFDKPVSGTEREDFLGDLDVLLQDALIGESETERTTICKWIRGSSSSSVKVKGETGSGLHVFIPVKGNADNIVQLIHRLCWLDDRFRGWRLTEAGTVLPESLIDGMVGSPERVIYTADAQISNRGNFDWIAAVERDCRYVPGGVLDAEIARTILETLCADFRYEWNIYRRSIESSPEVKQKRKEWKARQIKKYQKKGLDIKESKKIVEGLEEKIIYSNFTLLRNDGTQVSVRDILCNPDDWIDVGGFADPIKMEQSRNVGMILGSHDNLILHSFSHGGIKYKLRWDFEDLLNWAESCGVDELEENFALFGTLCGIHGITGVQEDRYIEIITDRLQCGKGGLRKDISETKKRIKKKQPPETIGDDSEADCLYDSKEDGSHMEAGATHGDVITDFLSFLPDCVSYGDTLYTWSGSSLWTGMNTGAIQKKIRVRYNHVERCKRVSDYRSIAGAIVTEEDIRTEQWVETPGFPCSDGFYEVSPDGFPGIDGDSGYKFIRLRRYEKEDYCRFKLGLKPDFDFEIESGMFNHILENVDNPVLLQQLCGLAVCGLLPQLQKVATFFGDGGAGKGTMFDILEALLPKSRLTSISIEQMNDPKYRINLADSRINFVSEIRKDRKIDLTGLKEIVGGGTITGRPLYMPPVSFKPNVGMILSMNEFFRLNEVGSAIQRRFGDTIVKFVRRNEFQIDGLAQMIIEKELPAVLAWCMTGVELWAEGGLDITLSKSLWEDWKLVEDPVALFIKEAVMTGGKGIHRTLAWDRYMKFCEESNVKPLRKGEFYVQMDKTLGKAVRKADGWTWRGYALN